MIVVVVVAVVASVSVIIIVIIGFRVFIKTVKNIKLHKCVAKVDINISYYSINLDIPYEILSIVLQSTDIISFIKLKNGTLLISIK